MSKIIKLISLFALAISLTACGKSEAELAKEAEAAVVAVFTAEVKETLKDPESAQFQNISVSGSNVYAELNAKNSYGGYVGFKPVVKYNGEIVKAYGDYKLFSLKHDGKKYLFAAANAKDKADLKAFIANPSEAVKTLKAAD